MKKLLPLLLLLGCTTLTEPVPAAPVGKYHVVDFLRVNTCGMDNRLAQKLTYGGGDFELTLTELGEAWGTGHFYSLLENRRISTLSPFSGRYRIISDTLHLSNTSQTWFERAKFYPWQDGLLIGRTVELCVLTEVTLSQ